MYYHFIELYKRLAAFNAVFIKKSVWNLITTAFENLSKASKRYKAHTHQLSVKKQQIDIK